MASGTCPGVSLFAAGRADCVRLKSLDGRRIRSDAETLARNCSRSHRWTTNIGPFILGHVTAGAPTRWTTGSGPVERGRMISAASQVTFRVGAARPGRRRVTASLGRVGPGKWPGGVIRLRLDLASPPFFLPASPLLRGLSHEAISGATMSPGRRRSAATMTPITLTGGFRTTITRTVKHFIPQVPAMTEAMMTRTRRTLNRGRGSNYGILLITMGTTLSAATARSPLNSPLPTKLTAVETGLS